MEKTIKYLENGEYHYATVKDVGDLAKLKTDSKDDLVTAINELFITGGEGPKKPDGYDELVDNVADAIQKQQQMTDTITNMQQSAQLSDAEMEHMKQVQEELHQEYLKAIKELNEAVDKAKADAADLDKKTSDLQDKLDETFASVDKEVSDVHKQLDSESAGLRKDLDDTKTSLESTRKDLLNNTQEFGVVNSEVKELKDKMDRRIWSTDLDPVREQVNKNTTEVSQTKDELKNKADQSSLDLVTNSVENLSTQVKENADGLKVSVKKDELGGDVARLLNDKTNLLLGTRNFSGDSWSNKTHWHEEPGYWKGLKVFSSTEMWSGLQYKYEVKQGQQYTFSFWARQEKDNSSASIVLSESDKGDQGIATPYVRGVHIGTEWKRYSLTFQAESDGIIYPRVEQNVQGNKLYIAGYKLELGSVATPWEPNEADVAENIEHNESQFNVYSDQIAGIVKKQEKMGDTERQLDTRITETAEGLKQTSKDLQDANGKITEFNSKLESTAQGLKTEYEKYTNEAIGQISDSSLNLIHNSAFQNKDDNFAQWQNISAKANIREDGNGLRWVEITQSGMTTSNPQGITSNYFSVKQGKVTVAVDIKNGDKAELDNDSVMFLELYNNEKKRVDFHWVTLSDLGLSKSLLNDHQVHRGLYRLAIDRTDAKYMTVKAHIIRNGDLWFTNFSARLSSIDDGGYTPNPDDLNQQILKMNTKIEEDAEHIALKANSVDVTRYIKDAVDNVQVGGANVLHNTDPTDEILKGDITANSWVCSSSGNGYGTTDSLGSPFNAKRYFRLRGNTQGEKDFNQRPVNWRDSKYSFSVYARLDPETTANAVSGYIRSWSTEKNAEVFRQNFTVNSREWKRLTFTIDASSFANDQTASFAFGISGYGSIDFAEPMLVTGTKAMDWYPASDDTSNEIKSAKDAAIQVASDQINLHVNELSTQFDDRLNKRVNEVKTASEKFTSDGIEQVVTKVTDVKNDVNNVNSKIDNLQVGTRNLLHHSDTFDGWHKGSSVSISSEKYLNGSVAVLQNSGSGGNALYSGLDVTNDEKHITWTVYARADNNGDKLHTELWGGGGLTDQPLTTEWKRYKFAGDHADTYNSFYLWGVNTNKGNIYVALPFAVVGNTIGSWSPNPDDVNQSIKDATEYKAVTGTIDFNNLKTQQKIFYKDTQATNTPAGGSYWYYLNVEPGTDGRIFQTAISDRDNITWVRTFADGWGSWIRQADQRNVDDLNNQISSFKTETTASVKNLGDRVTTEVNSITSRVDNLKAGSQNLIADGDASAYGATPWENTTFQMHPFYYNSTKLMFVIDTSAKTELTAGCPNWFPVKAGHQYTLYFNGFMSTNVSSYDVWLLGKKADAQGGWTDSYQIIAGERLDPGNNSIVTRTFTVPSSWNNYVAYVRFDNNGSTDGHSAVFFFNEVSLKEGNINTGYSPAPENTVNEIKKLNTKWDVANGQIQGKVTETDVNNILNGKGYATQSWAESNFRMKSDSIDLEVKKITDPISDKINNLQVGGRNLVAGTGQDTVIDDTANTGTRGWCFWVFNLTQQPKVGDQITVSSESTLTGKGNLGTYEVILYNSTTTANRSNSRRLTAGKRSSATLEVTNLNGTGDTVLLIYAGNIGDTEGKKNVIHHLKVELGNVATDWSPAPEDTTAEIKSAKDTAINVANDKVNVSSKELQGKIDTSHKELQDKIDDSNKELQGIKDITQWHTVSGPIDLNDLKTQTRIFYRDIQDKNSAVTGWQYIVVDSSSDKVTQTVWKDNSTIQYIRQFTGAWSNWVRQTNQNDIDEAKTGLREEIKSAKDAAIQVASDQINIHVNELSTQFDDKLNRRINEQKTASEKFTSDGIEQVVTKVTNVKNDVDRLGDTVNSIGSRNLLHNTSDQYRTLTGSDWFAKSTANDIYTSVANYHGGDQFTYAATITNPSNYPVRLVIYCYDESKNKKLKTILGAPVSANQPNARVAVTTFIDADTWWIRTNIETLQANTPQISIQVKDERLVEGTVSSSWSLNPDDINQNIDSLRTETTASVKNLGDRVTTEVNSITKKVDTNNGGGVNLLKATDFSSTDLTKLKDVWGSHFTLRDGKAMQLDQLKGNGDLDATQFLPVEPDTDYTLSFESYYNTVASGGSYNNIYTFIVEYKDQNNTTPHYLDHMRVVANTADRSKNIQTIHTQKDCHYVQVFFRASAKTLFSFWRPKLERGSVATPWTPAPEDTSDAIKQLNTKWDVANGQIQGKVTATDVNNILNGKGYATQSWAQTMFTMKSDAITLQAVRDNITNGIQNQVNDTRNQINGLQNQFNTQTGINLLKGTADFSGPWFNKNGKGWSYNGEWQPPTSENKSERNNNVVYQDSGHAWDGLGQTVELNTGEYTFSMWMWPTLSGNESMNIYMGDSQYDGTAKVNYSGYRYSASQPQNRWILVKTYLTVTQGGKLSIRPELNQASGTIYVASYMLQHGHVENPVWAPAPDDLAPKSIISSINITPDQIKIASNKIVIDGNTDIHGTLKVPEVKLQGKSGYVDLSGDGINIAKNNGAGMNIGANAIQITSNTNGQAEVEGVITPAWSSNNVNQNGIGLILTTEQELGGPYGGDILTIGTMPKSGVIHSAMVFDATGITGTYKKGFNWFAPHTLNGDGGVFRFPNAQDDLVAYAGNIPGSRQAGYSQPTLALVHGRARGSAGLQFQWDDLVPFGRINSSNTRVSSTAGSGGITVSWYSWGNWWDDMKAPAIVYVGDDGKYADGGIVFYPGGEVCVWHQQFRSYLQYGGLHQTD